MNRIILGTDYSNECEAAVRLLLRLRFRDAAVDMVHAIATPDYVGDPIYAPLAQEGFDVAMRANEESARKLGERMARRLCDAGITPGANIAPFGSAPRNLIEYADKFGADLIAVGSGESRGLLAFLKGSVSRALVTHAHQSVLVAKGNPASEGPIRAVFATDHSDYANQCAAELLRLAPEGISHLTILTCYPKDTTQVIRSFLPELSVDPSEAIENELLKRNVATKCALAPLGCELNTRVVHEDIDEGISQVMAQEGADLLILGAQGHGFFDRLTLGSTSFHQVAVEPYPVLVLRIPPAQ